MNKNAEAYLGKTTILLRQEMKLRIADMQIYEFWEFFLWSRYVLLH